MRQEGGGHDTLQGTIPEFAWGLKESNQQLSKNSRYLDRDTKRVPPEEKSIEQLYQPARLKFTTAR